MKQFSIPLSKKDQVEHHLNKLLKRSVRLGIGDFSWSFGKAFKAAREIVDQYHQIIKQEYIAIYITLDGITEDIKFNGWSFVATLQHMEEGNIVRRIDTDDTINLSEYHNVSANCEHCNILRRRNDTYILRNDNTGELKQVGSTCIKNFLGGNSPDNIIIRANIVAELFSLLTDDGLFGECSGNKDFYIKDVLMIASFVITRHGWLPKSKEDEEHISTATRVLDYLNYSTMNFIQIKKQITPEDTLKVEAALEWAENLSDDLCNQFDYLNNVRVISRCAYVSNRTLGIAVSILAAYERYKLAKEKDNLSNYVGSIKDKITIDLTLKKHIAWDNAYGVTHMYSFLDDNENCFIWKASSRHDFVENKKYLIKGTIKAHNLYKDIKQTELTRCKIMVSYEL